MSAIEAAQTAAAVRGLRFDAATPRPGMAAVPLYVSRASSHDARSGAAVHFTGEGPTEDEAYAALVERLAGKPDDPTGRCPSCPT